MMDVIINGGTLRSDNDHEVVANVEYVLQKAGEKEWRIYLKGLPAKRNFLKGNHSIFRHDNFIGCFSADKIKMSARK